MAEFLWHLLYVAIIAATAITVWHYRANIAAWWGSTAESRAKMKTTMQERLRKIKDDE